jgi:predicted O-methyltransferase YrrM
LIGGVVALRRLPVPVARFLMKARRAAKRRRDRSSIESSLHAEELAKVLELAEGRRHVAEIGTGAGWTAIALALADGDRRVMTVDPLPHRERRTYLDLVPRGVRLRIEFLDRGGEQGPPPSATSNLGFLLIDSSGEQHETVATFSTWSTSLAPGSAVAIRGYERPGVAAAVEELGLAGETFRTLFIWRAP